MSNADTHKPPQWAEENSEASDFLARERKEADLEARLPGVSLVFDGLVEQLQRDRLDGKQTEFPVAAAIVRLGEDGRIQVVTKATNQTNRNHSSIAHAELVALEEAQINGRNKHLPDSYLLTTLEPCVMCCGAAVNSGLSGVIYAVKHEDVAGKHAQVAGQFKPWRTSPSSFNADEYLIESGLTVVSGFKRQETLEAIARTTTGWTDYYSDPDA